MGPNREIYNKLFIFNYLQNLSGRAVDGYETKVQDTCKTFPLSGPGLSS